MTATEPTVITSMAKLFKMAFAGADLAPLRQSLLDRLQVNSFDSAAWMDLSLIQHLSGDQASGLYCQEQGLKQQCLYRSSWLASPRALRVLAFMIAGEVNANTPIDFLLEGFDVVLYSLYLSPDSRIPEDLPEHDIAIVAISESDRALPTLQRIETQLVPVWPCPILNRPSQIYYHSREKLYRLLADGPDLFMPPTKRFCRSTVEDLIRDPAQLPDQFAGANFPFIVRPISSHAGDGLEKLHSLHALQHYLGIHPEQEFFLSPFIDYRSPDGCFRKYRVMWVDGHPYPVHMAIAEEWKVWYLNAAMAASGWKRAEEEEFLSAFDTGFGARHATALQYIAERFGLDYFGIDCGELPDGRLLVFEGSVALAAHDMDAPEIYPYKSPQMRRLFKAFYRMLQDKGCQCR